MDHRRFLAPLVAGVIGFGPIGCQTDGIVADIGSAGQAMSEAATVPVEAARSAINRAGEALQGPDTSREGQTSLGDRLAAAALAKATRSDDKALEAHLTAMAERIARHAPGQSFDYRVYLIDDPAPNAFTPGGGHIFVTTGLVAQLAGEGQMAMVLAHEIAHSAEAHVVKGAHRRKFGERAASFSTGIPLIGDKLGMAINATVSLYTRDQEDQADEHGLDYMIAAGYHPAEAAATFETLMAAQGEPAGQGFGVFRGHSPKSRRIQRVENLLKAKHSGRDFSTAIRTTRTYDDLARRHRVKTGLVRTW